MRLSVCAKQRTHADSPSNVLRISSRVLIMVELFSALSHTTARSCIQSETVVEYYTNVYLLVDPILFQTFSKLASEIFACMTFVSLRKCWIQIC